MRVPKKTLAFAEILAFSAGVFVFWKLLRSVGFERLAELLSQAGLGASLIFVCYPFLCAWDVLSWKNLFPPSAAPRAGFLPLFWIRVAGEAVNNVTPIVDVGGEPLKARWISRRFGLSAPDAASATILAKTSLWIAEGAFVWMGLAAGWGMLSFSPGAREAFFAAAVLTGMVIGGLFLFQRTKLFGNWSPETARFYSSQTRRFVQAAGLNFIGWAAGAAELWVFSRVLGQPLGFREAFIVESLVQLVRTASFFIPGNVGTQEAGYMFLTHLLGAGPTVGMALSLLKRARQLAWTAIGFVVWAVFQMEARGVSRGPASDTGLDRWIHRPLGRPLARMLSRTPVTPNALTLANLIPAFAAAFFLSKAEVAFSVAGLGCFFVWSVVDHADGELARLKNLSSPFGRVLDDVCDIVASTAILVGLFAGLLPFWNAHDRAALSLLYYPAVFLNAAAGVLALYLHRQETGPSQGKADAGWRRIFRHLTGREPFYGCLLAALVTTATGSAVGYALLGGFLIVGQIGLFILAAWEFIRRQAARYNTGR